MYERSYGYRYDEAKGDSVAETAKRIRADIKQAVAEGLLPAHWNYSVRSDSFSGGTSIDVRVKNCADAWQDCDGSVPGTRHVWPDGSSTASACPNVWCAARNDPQYAHGAQPHQVLTEEARAAEITLARIHGAYNHDGSESQVDYFDVNYYGQVTFQDARSAEFEAEEKAKKAARKAAKEAATDRHVIAVYRRGESTTHVAVTVDGREKLLCGATLWGHSVTSRADGREVTCSRCAKKARA